VKTKEVVETVSSMAMSEMNYYQRQRAEQKDRQHAVAPVATAKFFLTPTLSSVSNKSDLDEQ
jgi:hypothetical protein